MNVLTIFAKAPVPGHVKTRLCPPLTAEQAARLYESFVADAVAGARLCGDAAVSVAYAPHPLRADLSWLRDAPPWFPQASGDLGARLVDAFDRGFGAGAAKTVVIGSDCPDLAPALLSRAFELLDEAPAVLGPAEDGGYYLVGLRRPMPHLFTDMEWSTPQVLERTIERLRRRGADYRLLDAARDVDEFEDLQALRLRLEAGRSFAPNARAVLRETPAAAPPLSQGRNSPKGGRK